MKGHLFLDVHADRNVTGLLQVVSIISGSLQRFNKMQQTCQNCQFANGLSKSGLLQCFICRLVTSLSITKF